MKSLVPILALFVVVGFIVPSNSEGVVLSKICRHIDPSDQVKLGECLFNKETFKGNGRTCATCHPGENNFTVDPKFINTLEAHNKLFVFENLAEFPGLQMCRPAGGLPNGNFCPNGDTDCDMGAGETCDNLENGALLRKFGLILENVDGFAQPGKMRGVPHTLSMKVNIESDDDTKFGGEDQKTHALGWSGDGSAGLINSNNVPFTGFCDGGTEVMCQGFSKVEADMMCSASCDGFAADGSLKAFAIGATIQHFTKDLRRRMHYEEHGKWERDFRLPTEEELEAMEAFQLAQGRQADIEDLSTIVFRSAFVNNGRDAFFDPASRCNDCHRNAGANGANVSPAGLNQNFNTGVEGMTESPHFLEPGGAPVDNGFGDATFNTPPLVEAADTAPFMHNNSVNTLEQAVSFYNSANFAFSPAQGIFGPPPNFLGLRPERVSSIAAFLRTINSLENIRIVLGNLEKAKTTCDKDDYEALILLALADTEDAWQVLEGTEYNLFGDAVNLLKDAYWDEESILERKIGKQCNWRGNKKVKYIKNINKAISKLHEARSLIVDDTPAP